MTLTDERSASAPPDTGIPPCSAVIWPEALPSQALIPCPELADGWYQGRCPCGHVRDGWLCAWHGAEAGEGGCRSCREQETGPHDCPLPLSRVHAGGAS